MGVKINKKSEYMEREEKKWRVVVRRVVWSPCFSSIFIVLDASLSSFLFFRDSLRFTFFSCFTCIFGLKYGERGHISDPSDLVTDRMVCGQYDRERGVTWRLPWPRDGRIALE